MLSLDHNKHLKLTKTPKADEITFAIEENYVMRPRDTFKAPIPTKRKRSTANVQQPSAVDKVLVYFKKTNNNMDDLHWIFLGYTKTVEKFSPHRQMKQNFLFPNC